MLEHMANSPFSVSALIRFHRVFAVFHVFVMAMHALVCLDAAHNHGRRERWREHEEK